MRDNQLLVFEDEYIFLEVLERQKKEEIWRRCCVQEIKLISLPQRPKELPALRQRMEIACSDEVLLNAIDGGCDLLLEFPMEGYTYAPLREIAFNSVCDRGHISGGALTKLSNEELSDVINTCIQHYSDTCLILYRDNKISAVHSGDESDYSILNAFELVTTLKNGLSDRFRNATFKDGFLTHSLCSATYELHDKKIIEIYKPYLEKMGYENISEFNAVLKFSTSDVAQCGANLYPYLTRGKTSIQIGTPLPLAHKHKATIETFAANVEGIYALFEQSVEKFEDLADLELQYPVDCFANICKKLSIANTYSSDALSLFEMTKKAKASALEMYIALWEIITAMNNNNEPETKIFATQEKIARVLTFNIKSFDKRKEMQ